MRVDLCRLRIRVKGLQQVIDSQSTKIASLLTQRELTALRRADESTGQGTVSHVTKYKLPNGGHMIQW